MLSALKRTTPLTFVYKKQNPESQMWSVYYFWDSLNAPQILTENYANTAKNRNSSSGNECTDLFCQKMFVASITRARKYYTKGRKSYNAKSAINTHILWETTVKKEIKSLLCLFKRSSCKHEVISILLRVIKQQRFNQT